MKEVQRLYNLLTEGIETPTDMLLLINDLFSVVLLLVKRVFEIEKSDKIRASLIDSLKAMVNSFLEKLMKLVTDNEMITLDKDDNKQWRTNNSQLSVDETHIRQSWYSYKWIQVIQECNKCYKSTMHETFNF